jgi:UDP-2,3-diacylglucosamine hydrolase
MTDKRLALVAGAHQLPFLVLEDLKKQGYEVFVIGIKNFCDSKLKPDMWMRLGGIGPVMRELKKRKIKKIAMVGALGHPNLSDIRPDITAIKILARIAIHQKGYDSMLAALNAEIEKLGFSVVAAQHLCPSLTFSVGIQTRTKPTKADIVDMERGIEVSKAIGKLDVGQSVVVHKQVLAIEAAEGTEKMLARVVDLRRSYKKFGGVLAKMVKPNQDLRADIPAIGVNTVNDVADAKLNGIVVDAKNCWAIDKEKLIKTANMRGIFIVAK